MANAKFAQLKGMKVGDSVVLPVNEVSFKELKNIRSLLKVHVVTQKVLGGVKVSILEGNGYEK